MKVWQRKRWVWERQWSSGAQLSTVALMHRRAKRAQSVQPCRQDRLEEGASLAGWVWWLQCRPLADRHLGSCPKERCGAQQSGACAWFGGVRCQARLFWFFLRGLHLTASISSFSFFTSLTMVVSHSPSQDQNVHQDSEGKQASATSTCIAGSLQVLNSSLKRIRLHENQQEPTVSRSDPDDEEWVRALIFTVDRLLGDP
ncbi:hypothetical protein B0O80DRAFT_195648 [Mortierella sp. GBAus27b]|nr:hypothetical protein B0O80DRAFT_195648 [Mortierella sp. GBAus27b]